MIAVAAALLAGPGAATPAGAEVPAVATTLGTWINPHGTVKVRTGMCGSVLCGHIVWASAEANADAAESGVPRLVGTELLGNYRPAGAGRWRGEVYVPDMGRRFASTIEPQGVDALRISGCILGGLICRSQIWHRA
ncbi:DUF2147 domain-containing protein [Sphingomonas sanxanigenens]|uniref:DUF2147 domain-containing protein n=1 Tax=Sphingomonas sanxanigenens DSM 19645 = NX02 TaxID=1123269 RepID=W0A9Z3_9SPHN|nr:DUF2147 domain-containing protein [Sphingomonas sanxanigenens]AHE53138.1 hypothetical protein NX02_07055 [Sphingomonas sanxanigenens DSM 19645 = NX02]